ncbi:F-box protein [Phanerochaete sordida]|uniref:F-box protein n=1 Tax=Phanerochaete sordida TaxID=48140 RepID=A0A9P3GFL2_9APHY|nr:F-box protein [Phanerochaete sordida]
MRVNLTKLPAEVQEMVISNLGLAEIMVVKKVSRHFRNLIQTSEGLNYRVEQLCMGSVDQPPLAKLPFKKRTEIQRRWREMWKTLRRQGTEERTVRAVFGQNCVSGSLYADRTATDTGIHDAPSNALRFVRIPSGKRYVQFAEWEVRDLPSFENFACDYDQDLLVLLECFEDTCTAQLCFRTCSTGEAHPLAKSSVLSGINVSQSAHWDMTDVKICAELVSINYFDSGENYFWVWNWKQGRLLFHFGDEHEDDVRMRGFAFIDHRRLIIATAGYSKYCYVMVFDCYDIPPGTVTTTATETMRYAAAIFRLPRARDSGHFEAFINLDCRPSLQAEHLAQDGSLFRWAPSTAVAVVTMDGDIEDFPESVVAIPTRIILEHLEAQPARTYPSPCKPVRWRSWGAGTTVLTGRTAVACGSRVATTLAREHDARIVIYDFESAAVLAREPEPDLEDVRLDPAYLEHRRALAQRATALDPDKWVDRTPGRAPFRTIWTDFTVRGSQSFELAEDGLVIMPERRWWEVPVAALSEAQTRLTLYTV